MPRDLAREINEAAQTPATLWQPEVGESVIGRVVAKDSVPSKFQPGDVTRLVIESDEGGLVTVLAYHVVLEREIQRQCPVIGDRIAIKRLEDPDGKAYRRYRVLVDHAPAPDDDDDIGFAMGTDPDRH